MKCKNKFCCSYSENIKDCDKFNDRGKKTCYAKNKYDKYVEIRNVLLEATTTPAMKD